MCGLVHRGCSVHWGNLMSILGCKIHQRVPWVHQGVGYYEYIGGCSVHWGISWCMWRIPWVHWGMFSTWGDIMSILGFSIEIERIYQVAPPNASWYPSDVLNITQCAHDTDVLMIFLRCTEHPPMYTWYPPTFIMISPDVLNMPQCTHESPHVLNIRWCTKYPPIYWTQIIQGEHFIDE